MNRGATQAQAKNYYETVYTAGVPVKTDDPAAVPDTQQHARGGQTARCFLLMN